MNNRRSAWFISYLILTLVLFKVSAFAADMPPVLSKSQSEEYIPEAAQKAIAESQRQLVVSIPLLGGGSRGSQGSAFLVSEDGWVVTALHILPRDLDILTKEGHITFGGVPVEFDFWAVMADLAILKLKNIPAGMKPATMAKDVSLYSMVYAKLTGLQRINGNDGQPIFVYFDGLPFRARVVARVPQFTTFPFGILRPTGMEYFYLDHDAKPGFSGGMFVNEKGEVVGMASYVDGGYTAIVSYLTILEAIEANREKESKNKADKDKKSSITKEGDQVQ